LIFGIGDWGILPWDDDRGQFGKLLYRCGAEAIWQIALQVWCGSNLANWFTGMVRWQFGKLPYRLTKKH